MSFAISSFIVISCVLIGCVFADPTVVEPGESSKIRYYLGSRMSSPREGHISISMFETSSTYFIGGETVTFEEGQINGSTPTLVKNITVLSSMERLEMTSRNVIPLPPMPIPRSQAGAEVDSSRDFIFVFGGIGLNGSIVHEIYVYRICKNLWIPVKWNLGKNTSDESIYLDNNARKHAAVIVIAATFVVIGGIEENGRVANSALYYEFNIDSSDIKTRVKLKSKSAPIPVPFSLSSHQAVYCGGYAYLGGGVNATDGRVSKKFFRWEPYASYAGTWIHLSPMIDERRGFAMVTYDNRVVLVVGGYTQNGELSSTLDGYNIINDQWVRLDTSTILANLDIQRAHLSISILRKTPESFIVISGGRNTTNTTDVIDVYAIQPINFIPPTPDVNNMSYYYGVGVGILCVLLLIVTVRVIRKMCFSRHDDDTNSSGLTHMNFSIDTRLMEGHSADLIEGASTDNSLDDFYDTRSTEFQRAQLLGKGSYGAVYVGIRPNGTLIAVKSIPLVASLSEGALEAIVREVNLMRHLPRHDNIIQYYSCVTDRKAHELNILMEYAEGGSLGQVCKKLTAPLSDGVVKKYTIQILRGLHHLHSHNVIHRDVKGDNVLIGSGGILKLGDFGTAKQIDMGGGTTSIAGTPLWMAPEVITGIAASHTDMVYNQKADIWSVGCVVVEMINKGKPAWPEFNTLYQAVYQIGSSTGMPTNVPKNLPPDLEDFLSACFNRDVDARPTAAELLNHPFLNINAGWVTVNVPREMTVPELTIEHLRNASPRTKSLRNVSFAAPEDLSGGEGNDDNPPINKAARSDSLGVTLHTSF